MNLLCTESTATNTAASSHVSSSSANFQFNLSPREENKTFVHLCLLFLLCHMFLAKTEAAAKVVVSKCIQSVSISFTPFSSLSPVFFADRFPSVHNVDFTEASATAAAAAGQASQHTH